MHRRLYAYLAALTAAPLLSGCAQMMTHSNMIVFGTNTVVGVRVGTAATQVPSIDVGYTRQEAVLMPVVANKAAGGAGDRLTPCDLGTDVAVVAGNPAPAGGQPLPAFVTPPCLLVASNAKEGARDSYSVLASFGANFGAGSEPSGASARGGLAQYFATGMAAQLLALNGGAAVVATGPAAATASANPPMTIGGVAPLSPAERAVLTPMVDGYQTQMKLLTDKVKTADPAKLANNIKAFETAIGSQAGYDLLCTGTPAACATTLTTSAAYLTQYNAKPDDFGKAVTAFPTVK